MFVTLKRQDFASDTSGPVTLNLSHIVQMEPVTLIGTGGVLGTQITLTSSDHGTSTKVTVHEELSQIVTEIRRVTS